MDTDGCLEPLPWETRNLSVEAFGVAPSFVANPDEARLRRTLTDLRGRHDRFFVQARVSPDSRLAQILSANGFYVVEATLSPSVALLHCAALDRFIANPPAVLPRRFRRDDLDLRVHEGADTATADAIEGMAEESFVDGRFHADHNCPAGAADRRYRRWIGDLLTDASVAVHVLRLRGGPVAFMASRDGDLLLAGFSRRYANAGLGEFFWLGVLERLRADGVTRARTLISVNNIAVLNLYGRLGFSLRDPRVTFHLWGPG